MLSTGVLSVIYPSYQLPRGRMNPRTELLRRFDNVALRRRDQINEIAVRARFDVDDDLKKKPTYLRYRDNIVWFQCVDAQQWRRRIM